MKNLASLLILLASQLLYGEWSPDNYEVLFTNPVCPQQRIVSYRPRNPEPISINTVSGARIKVSPQRKDVPFIPVEAKGIPTLGGGYRTHIPANVYCDSQDFAASTKPATENPYRKTDSPLQRIQEWIQSTRQDDQLFLASFSLSMPEVATWSCEAAQRGVRVKIFMHEPDSGSGGYDIVRACQKIELLQFKSKGRLAHMKSIMIEYKNRDQPEALRDKVRISFESGNISTGTWAHHENWNFLTLDRQHWLSRDHLCLRDAVSPESVGNMQRLFQDLDRCRQNSGVDGDRQNDPSIQDYFIPKTGGSYDDRKELDKIVGEVAKSSEVWVAAHHLTEPGLVKALALKLKEDPQFKVKLLIDSELFWANYRDKHDQGLTWRAEDRLYGESDSLTSWCRWDIPAEEAEDTQCSLFHAGEFGDPIEQILDANAKNQHRAYGPQTLVLAGAEMRMMEANHLEHFLFHNKFLISFYSRPENNVQGSVFTGAGNLTKSGFDKNFENYYLIRIPHVFEAFKNQFDELFSRASLEKDLPITWDYKTVDDGYQSYRTP